MASTSKTVLQWQKNIESVRSSTTDLYTGQPRSKFLSEDLYKTSIILTLISIESNGDPYAWRTNETKDGKKYKSQFVGLLQQGNGISTDRKVQRNSGRHVLGKPVNSNVSPSQAWPLSYYLYGEGKLAINEWLWHQSRFIDKTQGDIIEMSLIWKSGAGTYRKYKKLIDEGFSQSDAIIRANVGIVNGNEYIERVYDRHAAYAQAISDPSFVPPNFTSNDFNYYGPSNSIGGSRDISVTMETEDLSKFVTPEELRKGIIAEIFNFNDWHLAQLAEDTRQEDTNQPLERAEDVDFETANGEVQTDNVFRGETSTDIRKRYINAIVQAEFYRRRYSSRSVPSTTGPFNPFPVAGFPGLIMRKRRPILGYINSIQHTIDVSSGNASTSVSMSHPRYWDEGDPYHWLGGEEYSSSDPKTNILWRRVPQWHNRNAVATNNYDYKKRTKKSNLDKMYNFLLGCDSIEYQSVNTGKAGDAAKIEKTITLRDPQDFAINPETLDLIDYNNAIGQIGDNGRYKEGTIAYKFFGDIDPSDIGDATVDVESQIEYTRRYGIREYELFVDFLKNVPVLDNETGATIMVGETFGNPDEDTLNYLQIQVLDYIKDLRKRDLDGGI